MIDGTKSPGGWGVDGNMGLLIDDMVSCDPWQRKFSTKSEKSSDLSQ